MIDVPVKKGNEVIGTMSVDETKLPDANDYVFIVNGTGTLTDKAGVVSAFQLQEVWVQSDEEYARYLQWNVDGRP